MSFSIDSFKTLQLVSVFEHATSWEEQFCLDFESKFSDKKIEVVFLGDAKDQLAHQNMAAWYHSIDQYFVRHELSEYALASVVSTRKRLSKKEIRKESLIIDPYDVLGPEGFPHRLLIRIGSGKGTFEELYLALFEEEFRIKLSLIYCNQDQDFFLLETILGGHHFSLSININDSYWLAKSILLKYLRIGSVVVTNNLQQRLHFSKVRSQWLLLARIVGRRILSKLSSRKWHLLWRDGMGREKVISPPGNADWADPFLLEYEGTIHLFFEAFSSKEGNYGTIAHLTEDTLGEKRIAPVLDTGFHLSFPNIFQYEDALYMLPETGANRTISLYKAIEFPKAWEFAQDLLTDLKAVDSDIFQHEGRWWLFTCIQATPTKGTYHELHIFYAKTPLTDSWQPHPHNPVVISSVGGRLGGKLRKEGKRLIRVGQINTKTYGYGLCEMEIIRLTPHQYEEKHMRTIKPKSLGRTVKAIHTLNQVGSIQVLDYAK